MSIARELCHKIEQIDEHECFIFPGSDSTFRILEWDTVSRILQNYGGNWRECSCGSSYCDVCNGSYDASVVVTFPDGSRLEIANPNQSAFSREYTVCSC